MIGLLGERNLFYVSPALSEIYTTDGILTWAKVALFNIKKIGRDV